LNWTMLKPSFITRDQLSSTTKWDSQGVYSAAEVLIMPGARGLAANWEEGNRRECGTLLAHINNTGSEAGKFVAEMARVLKKVRLIKRMTFIEILLVTQKAIPSDHSQLDANRLLEAHLAYLTPAYLNWADSEPLEPESDRPTEEELAQFEEDTTAYRKSVSYPHVLILGSRLSTGLTRISLQFTKIEQLAARLSASLGVGSLKDKKLVACLQSFFRKGLHLSFVTNDGVYGNLPFLFILSK